MFGVLDMCTLRLFNGLYIFVAYSHVLMRNFGHYLVLPGEASFFLYGQFEGGPPALKRWFEDYGGLKLYLNNFYFEPNDLTTNKISEFRLK